MFGFLIGTLSLIGLVKVLRAGSPRMCGGGWRGHGGGGCGSRGYGPGPWGHGRGGGWGHGGWGHGGGGQWGRDGRGPDFDRGAPESRDGRDAGPFGLIPLRFLFQTLDTTVGQEKVIKAAYNEVKEAMRHGEGEAEETRAQIANAIRRGTVDETEMGELYARHDEKLRTIRTAFFGALAKVTDALDEDQRKKLADMLERSERGGSHRGGPYRQPGN